MKQRFACHKPSGDMNWKILYWSKNIFIVTKLMTLTTI